VGTALLQALLEWAESSPVIEKVCLDVFATNEPAIRLYKNLGFIEEAGPGISSVAPMTT
jgi:RimJ/RimL family protein N-acetyltransferase